MALNSASLKIPQNKTKNKRKIDIVEKYRSLE